MFIVFAGVLIAKLVIGEYKTEPSRSCLHIQSAEKLMAAKLLLTGGLTF
ncbi:hypothetical protein PO124_12370 [Bacillus licheniformis]|nr:hypothetical protein [Bacillus licheniformis]